jgi:hypothetical protein
VSAEWNVPSVLPEPSGVWYADSTWVGVGGWNQGSLLQAGTTEESYYGTVYYVVWDENLPGQQQEQSRFVVNPGDLIKATISQSAGSTWTISVVDETTGQADNQTETYTGSTATAEFIQEAPTNTSTGDVLPTDPYQQFPFFDAVVNGGLGQPEFLAAGDHAWTVDAVSPDHGGQCLQHRVGPADPSGA